MNGFTSTCQCLTAWNKMLNMCTIEKVFGNKSQRLPIRRFTLSLCTWMCTNPIGLVSALKDEILHWYDAKVQSKIKCIHSYTGQVCLFWRRLPICHLYFLLILAGKLLSILHIVIKDLLYCTEQFKLLHLALLLCQISVIVCIQICSLMFEKLACMDSDLAWVAWCICRGFMCSVQCYTVVSFGNSSFINL